MFVYFHDFDSWKFQFYVNFGADDNIEEVICKYFEVLFNINCNIIEKPTTFIESGFYFHD